MSIGARLRLVKKWLHDFCDILESMGVYTLKNSGKCAGKIALTNGEICVIVSAIVFILQWPKIRPFFVIFKHCHCVCCGEQCSGVCTTPLLISSCIALNVSATHLLGNALIILCLWYNKSQSQNSAIESSTCPRKWNVTHITTTRLVLRYWAKQIVKNTENNNK